MRKLFSFMLMAVGLLISGNVGANTEKPFSVYNADKNLVGEYATINDASAALTASNWCVKLTDDAIVSAQTNALLNKTNDTLDLNGHKLTINALVLFYKANSYVYHLQNGNIDGKSTIYLYTRTGQKLYVNNIKISTTANYPFFMSASNNTLIFDSQCEVTGKSYSVWMQNAGTYNIENEGKLLKPLYLNEKADGSYPILNLTNSGTVSGILFAKVSPSNHRITNNGVLTFNPNKDLTGTVTLTNNEGGEFTFAPSVNLTGTVDLTNNEGGELTLAPSVGLTGTLNIVNAANATINIEKGTYNANANITNNGTINISGGTFVDCTLPSTGTYVVSGGIFSEANKNVLENSLASGLKWHKIFYNGEAWQPIDENAVMFAELETGGKTYQFADLQDAFNAAPTNGQATIRLLKDSVVEWTAPAGTQYRNSVKLYTIGADRDIIFDMNGKKLKMVFTHHNYFGEPLGVGLSTGYYYSSYSIYSSSKLTIQDNTDTQQNGTGQGQLISCELYPDTLDGWLWTSLPENGYDIYGQYPCWGNYALGTADGTDVTINSGYFANETPAGTQYRGSDYIINAKSVTTKDVHITINGGRIYNKTNYAIRMQGVKGNYTTYITLNEGIVESGYEGYKSSAIYMQGTSSGTCNMNFTMNGGQLLCNGTYALVADSWGGNRNGLTVNITDGIIKGYLALGLKSDRLENSETYTFENVNISGGYFEAMDGYDYTYGVVSYVHNESGVKVGRWITGGHYKMASNTLTYTTDAIGGKIYDNWANYIASGYEAILEDPDNHIWTIGEITETATTKSDGTNNWSLSTTWNMEESLSEVPDESSFVTINKPIEVTSKDAVAKEINMLGEGAVVVTDGAHLNVGKGGITVPTEATSTNVLVEAGGLLTVEGLIYNTDVSSIKVEADYNPETGEARVGHLLISPEREVYGVNHPNATFELKSRSFYKNGKTVWQRFGIPTFNEIESITCDNEDITSYIYAYDYDETDDWYSLGKLGDPSFNKSALGVPFACYQLACDASEPGTKYTFKGGLMGNTNAELPLKFGWNCYANSYTGPINLSQFWSNIIDRAGQDVTGTIYVYRSMGPDAYGWEPVDGSNVGEDDNLHTVIEPMQAFILRLEKGSTSATDIDYKTMVWNPVINGENEPEVFSAPARAMSNNTKAKITITCGQLTDNVILMESDRFTDATDNGYDAPKYMNENINFYATIGSDKMAHVATNDIDAQYLGISCDRSGTYTMAFSRIEGDDLVLIDLVENREIAIAEDLEYEFNAEQGTNDYRFLVKHQTKMLPTNIANIYDSASLNGVYTILGQFVGSMEKWNMLPKGVYVVNGKRIVK